MFIVQGWIIKKNWRDCRMISAFGRNQTRQQSSMTSHQSQAKKTLVNNHMFTQLGRWPDLPRGVERLLCLNYRAVWNGLSWPYNEQRMELQRRGKITSLIYFCLVLYFIFSLLNSNTFSWLRQNKAILLSGCCITQEIRLYYWELHCTHPMVQKSIF